jgi:murein tripeptide amidase MpaA
MGPVASFTPFQITQGDKQFSVAAKRANEAKAIDTDKNQQIDDTEIVDFLQQNGDLPDPSLGKKVNLDKVVSDYKAHLRGELSPHKHSYHTYEQISAELTALAEKYPDKAEKVSLGKTHEGREIWALRVSSDVKSEATADKPGLVITGLHHAREWATSEVPTNAARTTLENYDKDANAKNRVDQAELWFVPVVNPDGYEYSRNEDAFWRKNRRPITETPCGPVKGDVRGVDLNRNYSDGKPEHAHIWRPAGDNQCSFRDDGRATSDDPRKDTYRGPSGGSEVEVQSLLDLQLGRKNIKGILDFHSYGGMLLYPWGGTRDKVENVDTYRRIGSAMNDAIGDERYRLMQSVELYPTSGGSHDVHHINGKFSITAEIGDSFHPSASELPGVVEQGTRIATSFIDQVLADKALLA